MGISVFPAAGGGVSLQQAIFTSSGTFILPSGYGAGKPLIVDLEIVGGGGGGGSGVAQNDNSYGGGGGGSGITAVYKSIPLTANATITIGSGGAGGAAVAPNSDGINGNSGGTTDVNSIYYAPGGGFGSKAVIASIALVAGIIDSHGYNVLSGSQTGINGLGGAGGSGGAYSLSISSNPGTAITYRGGARGLPGGAYQKGSGATAISTPTANGNGVYTQGINTLLASSMAYGSDSNQRGGGGAGGRGATSSFSGRGGDAGTRFTGGISGWNDAGTPNGGNATDAGCGGGGGGGSNTNGNSGAGGSGANGLVIVTYWA